MTPEMHPDQIIAHLKMQPHPEGGHYVETYRDPDLDVSGRARSSLIYFLLQVGEVSHWHRVDAVEVWHWYAGAPLALSISENGEDARAVHLGPNLLSHQQPQAVVPKGAWQAAESLGAWTLVGCTVAPAFDFGGFELAAPDWFPKPRSGTIRG